MTREAMTGFIDLGANPLSVVTVQSLGDLGYFVNPFGADDFSLPFDPASAAQPRYINGTAIDLSDDVLDQPLSVVRRDGAVTAVIR